jgi:hypothetical protein
MASKGQDKSKETPATGSSNGATDPKAPAVAEATLLRKITIREVMGKDYMRNILPVLIPLEGKKASTVPLLRVFGVANRYKPGTSDLGEYVKFFGQFLATNLITGDEFTGVQCILPNFIGEQIHASMMGSGGEIHESQWAFEIGAHYDPDAATKYVYDIRPLERPNTTSAVNLLRANIEGRTLALSHKTTEAP